MEKTYQQLKENVEKRNHFIVSSKARKVGSYLIEYFLKKENKKFEDVYLELESIVLESDSELIKRIQRKEMDILVIHDGEYAFSELFIGKNSSVVYQEEIVKAAFENGIQVIFVTQNKKERTFFWKTVTNENYPIVQLNGEEVLIHLMENTTVLDHIAERKLS